MLENTGKGAHLFVKEKCLTRAYLPINYAHLTCQYNILRWQISAFLVVRSVVTSSFIQ